MTEPVRWAVQWRSRYTRNLMWDDGMPLLFHTRREAREVIRQRWGYIASRRDLRRAPHWWRMPRAVKVRVVLEEIQND